MSNGNGVNSAGEAVSEVDVSTEVSDRVTYMPSVVNGLYNGLYRAVLVDRRKWDEMSSELPLGTWKPFTEDEFAQVNNPEGLSPRELERNGGGLGCGVDVIWVLDQQKQGALVQAVALDVARRIDGCIVRKNIFPAKVNPAVAVE